MAPGSSWRTQTCSCAGRGKLPGVRSEATFGEATPLTSTRCVVLPSASTPRVKRSSAFDWSTARTVRSTGTDGAVVSAIVVAVTWLLSADELYAASHACTRNS